MFSEKEIELKCDFTTTKGWLYHEEIVVLSCTVTWWSPMKRDHMISYVECLGNSETHEHVRRGLCEKMAHPNSWAACGHPSPQHCGDLPIWGDAV